MTLAELKQLQRQFDEQHRGTYPFYEEISEERIDVLEHLLVCLLGELGEFANATKKIRRGDYTLAEIKPQLDEELTDVFIYLLKLSNQLGVDLEEAFLVKLRQNEERFAKYSR
jgi:NTP pyrophosphatase (non-canonical NTP hydrolase)